MRQVTRPLAKRKGKRRKSGGKRRKKGSRKKSFRLGLLGKIGVAIAVIPPILFAAIDAFTAFQKSAVGTDQIDIGSKLAYTFASFMDSISKGFTGQKIFGQMRLSVNQGTGFVAVDTVVTVPDFAWAKTTGLGLTMIVTDLVTSALVNFAARKKTGVRIMGRQVTSGG